MVKPIAGVEVGLVDGVITVNPTKAQMKASTLHLTLAGTKDGGCVFMYIEYTELCLTSAAYYHLQTIYSHLI